MALPGVAAGLIIKGASNDHKTANEFVQKYQNPMHADVGNIIAPITQAREAGTLTFDQLTAAQDALEERLSKFGYDADAFAVKGGDEFKAVEQARTKLDPIFKSWRDTFADDAKRLGPKLELPEVPTLQSILAGQGKTAIGEARNAAERVRKHRGSALSSILTGYKGTTGTTTRKTAAVGY